MRRLRARRTLPTSRQSVAINYPLQDRSPQRALDPDHNTLSVTQRFCWAISDLRTQCFWLRNKQKVLSHVGSARTLRSRPPCASPAGPCIADSSRPLRTIHQRGRRDLGGNARTAETEKTHRQPAGRVQILATTTRTSSCRRRLKAASTVSAQPLQVKSPPSHVSGSTLPWPSLEPNSSPHHVISRLLMTSAKEQKDHTFQPRLPQLFCAHNMDGAPESQTKGEQEEGGP